MMTWLKPVKKGLQNDRSLYEPLPKLQHRAGLYPKHRIFGGQAKAVREDGHGWLRLMSG